MSKANPEVDGFFRKARKWREEMERLRAIVLDCGLTEELKWYQPCYAYDGHNVAIVSKFRDFCVLSFFKGVLLKDPEGILVAPGENSQSTRQIQFTSVDEVARLEATIRAYVHEAVEVEKSGRKVPLKKTRDYEVPEELQEKLDADPDFKAAWEALTPGRQRGYLLHFSAAKQSRTRASRVERHRQRILEGKGMHDR